MSAKKFALHAQNTPKLVFLRLLGEFFAQMRLERLCWASFFAEEPLEGALLGEFFRDPAVV